jgi:hypothetical protein
MPCPDPSKAAKQTKKTKKKKVTAPAALPDNSATADNATETAPTENATASEDLPDSESASPASKAKVTGKKNRYSKNGLLQKSKYKRLRSNPARKTRRQKQSIFSKLFSGDKTKKKTKSKSKSVVSPDEE